MADEPKPPKPYIPPVPDEATRLYWDRLDAKFASPNASPPPPEQPSADEAPALIAEAFAALLALEDGQPGAHPVRLTTGADQPPPPVEPKITDAVIEDVVRRVIERLGPDAVRAVVVDVVSQISERLVKEEIDRIRKQHV
jgi:hypothetical protein